jgi:hypothetical protein
LENNNQELGACRKPEGVFNTCVFEKLVIYANIYEVSGYKLNIIINRV